MTKQKSAPGSKTRILIVDDHPLIRRGLRELISVEPDLQVCGEAVEAPEAMVLVDRLQPQLVLIDISLKRGHGLELIRQIRARNPSVKMLVVSMHDESLFAERALRAGASGYVNKQDATIKVAEAIQTVLAGGIYLSQVMAQRLLKQSSRLPASLERLPMDSLSTRELAVFELIGHGLTTRAIADKLQVGVKTVETHREHIKRKLQIKNSPELVHRATRWVLEKAV